MLDLNCIKGRLAEYQKSRDFLEQTSYHTAIPPIQSMEDIAALVAEVGRLRSAIQKHQEITEQSKPYGALTRLDKTLWMVLDD